MRATAAFDHKPIDFVGAFSFPFFLIGAAAKPPFTNIWQVGLTAKAHLPL